MADEHLAKNNIMTYDVTFEDFERDVWSESSPRVDLVLSAVPTSISTDVLSKLPPFTKSVLKTGSYVFLIVSESQYLQLVQSFKELNFKVCDHPFNILYDTTTMRKRKSSDFPLRNSDIALLARTQ